MPTPADDPKDIAAPPGMEHDTWAECRVCHRTWKDAEATPDVLHRYTVCPDCQQKAR